MKGGMQYFSLVIITITSFFGLLFLLLITSTLLFLINPQIQGNVKGTMTYDFYEQTKAESILLAYMDTTYEGKAMADLLALAVYNGEVKDGLSDASKEIIDKITSKNYKLLLEVGGGHILLAGSEDMHGDTSAEALISANGKEGLLKLEVSE